MDRCSRLKLLRLHLQLHNQEGTNIGNKIVRHIPDPEIKQNSRPLEDLGSRSTDPVDVASDIGMQKPAARRRIYDFCTLYTKTVDAHLSKQQVS